MGSLGQGESTSSLYQGLGIANDLVFFRMNPEAYEHCRIGDQLINLPGNFDRLYKALSARFPAEKKGLKKYLQIVRQVSTQLQLIPKMNGFWDNITIPYRTRHLGKYGLFSLKKVIGWHIKDPLLKKVLNMQCGNHGLPPSKASFPLHCAVMDHYFNGGYYPMGGGAAIVKAMTGAIKKYGGEVRTGQRVKRILLEGGKKLRAVGVELENGEQIRAKRVVSNADPGKTYLDMVGAENLSRKLTKKLAKTRYSVTSIMLFLTVDMDLRKAGLDSGNLWMMQDRDPDEMFEDLKTVDILAEDEFPGVFISCPTLKDPVSYDGRHHTLEVITFTDYASFKSYKHEGKIHSVEYAKFKERLSNKLLNSLEKVVPGIRSHIVQMELGTPLTNEYYINSTNGNLYGTEKNPRQVGPFSFGNQSEIENLYLCGASILAHGVAGATYSGVQTAAKILNCRDDDLLKPDPSQDLRIYDAEDSTHWPPWIHQKIKDKKNRLHSQFMTGQENKNNAGLPDKTSPF